MQCFGTDGEEALYEAFQHEFPVSIHLQCFNHVRRNIKSKLQELAVSESTTQLIMGDVFGRVVESQHFDGLVDAEDDQEYDRGLQSLCQKWKLYDNNRGPIHSFCWWFECYKSTTINRQCCAQKPCKCDVSVGTKLACNSSTLEQLYTDTQTDYCNPAAHAQRVNYVHTLLQLQRKQVIWKALRGGLRSRKNTQISPN